MTNHTLCIIEILMYLSPLPVPAWIGLGIYVVVAYLIAFFIGMKFLKRPRRAVPASFYAFALLMNIGVYSLGCFLGHYQYLLINVFGAISFLVSDLLLAYSLFVKGNQKSRHLVMATYLIAQFLIAFGFTMTLLR